MFKTFSKKIISLFITFVVILPLLPASAPAMALQMPQNGNELASMSNINAKAYIVTDLETGKTLIDSNADMLWTPASLTKLVTALVVLDTKPKLTKVVAMTKADQIAGGCSVGGECIKTIVGTKFTVDGLFHAALMPSANNAANALARSTGLSSSQFVAKMNAKVKSLGATNSHFTEPTGMDPANKITASDYAKIVSAAFSNTYLKNIAQLKTYALRSTNSSKYTQTIKNTDGLLTSNDVKIVGAKTGYLNESLYNFASVLKYNNGSQLAIVVLGENHLYSAFSDTTILASLAEQSRNLAFASN
ncbi:MAG: hypothetical protein JWO40_366 [Candidatus Doudnabacteria bacterium]|nr:hypothetical protein [Candidatus Doudnabacteria bacterium]